MERWDFCISLATPDRFQLLTPEGERVGPDDLTGQQAYCLILALNLREGRVATVKQQLDKVAVPLAPEHIVKRAYRDTSGGLPTSPGSEF